MKTIYFRKSTDVEKGRKKLSIKQKTDDKESITYVRKSFLYNVSKSIEKNPKADQPQIYIKKSFNTKKKIEKFSFLVKGKFYMTHEKQLIEVQFQHCLNIKISWKTKIFSSKDTTVLS